MEPQQTINDDSGGSECVIREAKMGASAPFLRFIVDNIRLFIHSVMLCLL